MDTPDIAQRLEQFMRSSFGIVHDDPYFSRSVDLFDSGYLDSIGVIETLAYVTDTFGVVVPDELLLSEEFTSINGMTEVITRLIKKESVSPSQPRQV